MEKTLVILKPSAILRGFAGEVIRRFEQKGLMIIGMKMMTLSDEILAEHYSHLVDKPFLLNAAIPGSCNVCEGLGGC